MAVKFPNKAKAAKSPKGGKMGMMGNKGSKKGMMAKGSKKGMKKNKKNKKAKKNKKNKGGKVPVGPTPAPSPAPTRAPTRPPTRAPTPAPTAAGLQTITGFVRSNPTTSTLFAALERANFVDALDQPGNNFTLFAPTNAGFGEIPAEIVDLLFTQDEFIPHLQNLLLYHLLPGARLASEFPNATIVQTFNTERVRLLQQPFRVNGIPIVTPDNLVSNGVVQTIAGVLAPTWVFNTIINRVAADPELSILLEFLVLAELGNALNNFGEEFTLLAPTNTAFNNLGNATLAALRLQENRAILVRILLYHVVIRIFTTPELTNGLRLLTVETGFVNVTTAPLRFNLANAVAVDILANNGVVHKIDAVLDPIDG